MEARKSKFQFNTPFNVEIFVHYLPQTDSLSCSVGHALGGPFITVGQVTAEVTIPLHSLPVPRKELEAHVRHLESENKGLRHLLARTLGFKPSPDDIFRWPDGTECTREEYASGTCSHMSDDFTVIPEEESDNDNG